MAQASRHAINCAISAFHMAEWIWGDWLEKDYLTWGKLKIRTRDEFFGWVDSRTPWFKIAQSIANGSKHFASKLQNTKSSGTYAAPGYAQPGYQTQYLEVEIEDDRWIEAVIVLEDVVMFWESFFTTYRPEAQLAQPRNPFTRMPD